VLVLTLLVVLVRVDCFFGDKDKSEASAKKKDPMGWGLEAAEEHVEADREESRVDKMEAEEDGSSGDTSSTALAKECPKFQDFDFNNCGGSQGFPLNMKNDCGSGSADSIYLPSAELYRCQNLRSKLPLEIKKRADVMRKIHNLQNPRDCDKPANPWHLIKLPTFGLGSDVWHLAMAAMYNWQGGAPSMIPNSAWRFSDKKCGAGWSCFLTPLSR
jgi:hypothetical protein